MQAVQLLFFHGGEILALFGGVLLGFSLILGMLLWALAGPRLPWSVPGIYLIVGLATTTFEGFGNSFFGSMIFAFPWSALLVYISTFVLNQDSGMAWIIASILLNAVLVYMLARVRRSHDS